jgi:hypothetical protein
MTRDSILLAAHNFPTESYSTVVFERPIRTDHQLFALDDTPRLTLAVIRLQRGSLLQGPQ